MRSVGSVGHDFIVEKVRELEMESLLTMNVKCAVLEGEEPGIMQSTIAGTER